MKRVIIILCACLFALSSCKEKEKPAKQVEMGEKTTTFLQGDPYAEMPRMVEITPDSLKNPNAPNIDSTAYILGKNSTGALSNQITCKVSYSQGKVYIVENLHNGVRDSVCTAYYPNGQLWSQETYRNGLQIGDELAYQENGYPLYIGQYDNNGNCTGTWKYYRKNGELDHSVSVNEQTIQCGHCAKCVLLKHQRQGKKIAK